jgi:class III poly(R)-hydroxyalkanoic acid synthase PhaE subunit
MHTVNAHSHSSTPPDWITTWLHAQQTWMQQWQEAAARQTAASPDAMQAMREQLQALTRSSAALNVAEQLQSLLQAGLAAANTLAQQAGADAFKPLDWQQMLQAFPLGPAREQQRAWQDYVQAQTAYQQQAQALLHAYGEVFAQSLSAVGQQVEAMKQQGKPPASLRELHDLWVECGERAFAAQAHAPAFIALQSAATNALSQLQQAQQPLLEHWLKQHDLPTRSELNSVHLRLRQLTQRVAELEQQLQTRRSESP